MSLYLKGEINAQVKVDEVDFMGRLKLSAMMRYMQDAATGHAEQIGVGFGALYAQNFLWVQTSMNAQIKSLPRVGDRIKVVTFPHAPGLAECVRDYYLYRDGEEFARATTTWCVIDLFSRRIKKAKDLFAFDSDKYTPESALPSATRKFDVCQSLEDAYTSCVRYSDLDRNRHMNNTYYGDMMMNSCDISMLETNDVVEFDMNFSHELRLGDAYTVRAGADEAYKYATAVSDGGDVFYCRYRLQPRSADEV